LFHWGGEINWDWLRDVKSKRTEGESTGKNKYCSKKVGRGGRNQSIKKEGTRARRGLLFLSIKAKVSSKQEEESRRFMSTRGGWGRKKSALRGEGQPSQNS